ncbi:MAG: aminotransferase class IV [bacterium]
MLRSRVFFDGSIRWEDEALISPLSTGLLYGDGVFEILRAYDGVPFLFAEHYRKLSASCEALKLNLAYDEENLWLITRELIRQNDLSNGDAYVRITVFGAELNMITSPAGVTTHSFAHVRRFTPPKQSKYDEGIKARISNYKVSPFNPIAGHSTICYLPMIIARRAAWERGLDEIFITSTEGGIIEGSTSNLFIVSNGKITTPPTDSGIIPGVTRKAVLELAGELGITAREKTITPKMLRDADEVFITNSLIQIMPVSEIDGEPVGKSPYPIADKLLAAYRLLIREECAVV